MKKHEAKDHTKLEAWARHFLKSRGGCAIELKHTRGRKSLPFSDLEDHQKEALQAFAKGFVWKIDDTGYRQKPFDIIGSSGGAAFVAVRYPKVIAIIFIHDWCEEEEKSYRKSLTEERARKIAYYCIRI